MPMFLLKYGCYPPYICETLFHPSSFSIFVETHHGKCMLTWHGATHCKYQHLSMFPTYLEPWIHPHLFCMEKYCSKRVWSVSSCLVQWYKRPHASNKQKIPTTFILLESSESPGKCEVFMMMSELRNSFLLLVFLLMGLISLVMTNSILKMCELLQLS